MSVGASAAPDSGQAEQPDERHGEWDCLWPFIAGGAGVGVTAGAITGIVEFKNLGGFRGLGIGVAAGLVGGALLGAMLPIADGFHLHPHSAGDL